MRREFKRSEDMFAQDSIHLLEVSGIDFAQMEARGIEVYRFGEVLMSSGIVLNDEVSRGEPCPGYACQGKAPSSQGVLLRLWRLTGPPLGSRVGC